MTLNILLVEDQEQHTKDALAYAGERPSYYGVSHVTNLTDAITEIEKDEYDGVISDVFFPKIANGDEQENGTELASYALAINLPLVLCTSTYHHGPKTEPVNQFSKINGVPLVDNTEFDIRYDRDGEAENKKWDMAFRKFVIQYELLNNTIYIAERASLNEMTRKAQELRNEYGWKHSLVQQSQEQRDEKELQVAKAVFKSMKGTYEFALTEDEFRSAIYWRTPFRHGS